MFRSGSESAWSLARAHRPVPELPEQIEAVSEEFVPLRLAKTRTRFREDLLRCVHECHTILGNLVHFQCKICKNRFVAFHPDHEPEPDMSLHILTTYSNKVDTWDTLPPPGRSKVATFHKGRCKRCADSLKKVEADDSLRNVVTFSAPNMMDLLWGVPDVDASLGPDEARRLQALHYCFDNATVVEEMLVALLHMQVDVCYLQQGRRHQYTGMPAFRKNIIAFPQELAEVKQLLHFWTSLVPNDVVNVAPADDAADAAAQGVVRARVVALRAAGVLVEHVDATREHVNFARVRQRVRLPRKPEDLRDNFIVLRRRNARREDYVEDLRVRRNFLLPL